MINQELTYEELMNQTRCVSHEIKNYLSICDMYTQIIRRNCEKENIQNESINNALDCIQKSLTLINTSLLDLKSINCNLTPKACKIDDIISQAIDFAKAYINDKNIKITKLIKNNSQILIDETRFTACIVNIIKNAIEAIEIKGEIDIISETKNNKVTIKLTNNGKAIPKLKQTKIFKQGFTTKETGSGLGLAICKSFLKSQNADLNLVKSLPSKTIFEITLPIFKE